MNESNDKNQLDLSPAAQLLFDLVSTPSISGDERPAARVFADAATRLGFQAHIDQADNAVAHRGAHQNDASIHLVLLGHIDTVPGNIPVRIENRVLHGRGAVDAKGPLAAMLVAASRAALPEPVRITVAGAAGEEAAGSVGARHLVTQWTPDACIIGEPSSFDGVTLGYKGRLLASATASVSGAHSAGQSLSAADELCAWWASVTDLVSTFNKGLSRVFDQLQATIQSTRSSSDGLSQSATFEAGFRLPTTIDPDQLAARLSALASEHIHLGFQGAERASVTDRNDPVVRALCGAIRAHGFTPRPKLKTGTADLNVVAPVWKCPIAAYGPGDSALDHTPIEHIDLDEYDRSIAILTNAIESLAAELLAAKALPDLARI